MRILTMMTVFLLVPFLTAQDTDKNSKQYFQLSDPVTHQVDFSVVVTPPYHCKVLKVWIPLPQDTDFQTISDRSISSFPMEVKPQISKEPVYGNQFAYFEFHDPQGAQIIRHQFKAKVHEVHWNLDPKKVVALDESQGDFEKYITPESIEHQDQLNQVITNLKANGLNESPGIFSAMDWIDQNLSYSHSNASLSADPNHAITQKVGHCSDYHGLCATMGRMMGYPTRVAYGLALYPKNSPSHCKLEVYLPPYGWVTFDLSETQKMVLKVQKDDSISQAEKKKLIRAIKDRTFNGFRENSWLEVTNGVIYDLAPKASKPVRVVRTAYVEADGVALPEPDPADIKRNEYSWMTSHKYTSDRPFLFPFKDRVTLEIK